MNDFFLGDLRLVALLQLLAGLAHRHQLRRQDHQELPLAHPVLVHHDLLRLPALVLIVELHQEFLGHVLHVVDHLLVLGAVLHPHLDLIVGGLGLDA